MALKMGDTVLFVLIFAYPSKSEYNKTHFATTDDISGYISAITSRYVLMVFVTVI